MLKETREFVELGSTILNNSNKWIELYKGAKIMVCTCRTAKTANLWDLLYKRKAFALSIPGTEKVAVACERSRCFFPDNIDEPSILSKVYF